MVCCPRWPIYVPLSWLETQDDPSMFLYLRLGTQDEPSMCLYLRFVVQDDPSMFLYLRLEAQDLPPSRSTAAISCFKYLPRKYKKVYPPGGLLWIRIQVLGISGFLIRETKYSFGSRFPGPYYQNCWFTKKKYMYIFFFRGGERLLCWQPLIMLIISLWTFLSFLLILLL